MNRLFVAFWAALFILFSCTGVGGGSRDSSSEVDTVSFVDTLIADTFVVVEEEQVMPASADELFDDFFFNFIENERLQKSRISFPLSVKADDVPMQVIERSEWAKETFFLAQGFYTLILDNEEQMESVKAMDIDSVVVETILFNTQTVRQHFFKRTHGTWQLVEINNQPLYKNRNANFLNFYQQFSTDSIFQQKSLSARVAFSSPDPDDDFSRMEGVITPDTWFAFVPELPREIIYNINYDTIGEEVSEIKIFVIRGISNGEETLLTFEKHGEKWRLIKLDA